MKVDVGNERNVCTFADLDHCRSGIVVWNGDADDLATGRNHFLDLPDGAVDIARVGFGHRLDDDRSSAANLNVPHHDGFCNSPHNQKFTEFTESCRVAGSCLSLNSATLQLPTTP